MLVGNGDIEVGVTELLGHHAMEPGRPVMFSKARFTARNTRSGDSTTEAVGDASNINPKSICAMADPLPAP
ncbi:hypothetical protein [Actinomadura sp. B10D3]|uniref:hypothetical protein n=1 Tax=Actinomadura sp. B10D3 TaxID=3153557 RepID=UPI00325D6E8D